jgi:hypothetical protein
MSEQQISRLNLYSGIHKALRAYMNDTVQRTSRIDAEDGEDLSGGLRQVRELLAFMRKHLQHEAKHVHPAMNARRPGSAQVTEGDHDHHDWAIDKLNALCDHVEQASGARRTAQLYHLQLQLSVFVGENLVHMNMEETENNAVLWACYTDEELEGIHYAIVSGIPPEEMQFTMRWMLPALNPQERAGMLLGMRAGMPPPVFEGFLAFACSLLDERDVRKLKAALDAPQALAA